MPSASRQIVAQPLVVRACGHPQKFPHYAVDRYRDQRLAKFQRTRCPDCATRLNADQQRAAAAQRPPGEVLRSLPPGTQVGLTWQPDGSWTGTLSAEGITVEEAGLPGAGPQSVVIALARRWSLAAGPAAE